MGGVTTVIRVVRQVRVANTDQPGPAAPLLREQQQPQLRSEDEKNDRCINAAVLLVLYFIGIVSTVFGAMHLNDCPADKTLPTFSVIFGGLLLVLRLLNCVYDCRSICQEEYSEDNVPSCLEFLNNLFTLAITGAFFYLCVTVFRMDPTTNKEDHDLKNYCDYGLYTTCFNGCIIGLVFFGLMCIIICIVGICLFFKKNC